ncbi:MAG: SPFH domain-containing protein [Christensenellales bacterium]
MAKELPKIIIDYEGPNEQLVWQSQIQQCIGETEVIVPFSHEVIFIKDGEMLDTMMPGKHTLNVPTVTKGFLGIGKKIVSEPFKCQVFFVNKTVTLVVPWGTPNQMKLMDPFLEYPVSVGAHGSFDITISNSRKFVSKVVGNTAGVTTEGLQRFFADKMIMRVKDVIANAMVTSKINFYELNTRLLTICDVILDSVRKMFDDYGVEITAFTLNEVKIPDSDLRELESILKQKKLLGLKETSFSKERAAKQETTKMIVDASVRLAEAAIDAEGKKQQVIINNNAQAGKYCPKCGTKVAPDAMFCNNCGNRLQ